MTADTLRFILLFSIISSVTADPYTQCSTTNCLTNDCGKSSNCCLKDRNCDFIVGLDYNHQAKELNILLYTSDDNNYIALGVSDDYGMGDDDVIACFKIQNLVVYYGRTKDKSGVTTITTVNSTTLTDFKMEATNGGLSCQWKLPISSLPQDFKFKVFDKDQTYYLLAAVGPVTGSNSDYKLKYHSKYHTLTSVKLNFGKIVHLVASAGSHQYVEHRIHIFCMIWAWMFFTPVGILISRFYKETWAKVHFCRRRLWFTLHVVTMLLGLMFCLVGYIPILVKNKSSFQNPIHYKGLPVHQWIGFTAIILFVLQVIPKWFHILNPLLRQVISGGHAFFGLTCYVLGSFNIVTAHIFTGETLPLENNLQFVGIASIVITIIFFIFLSATYSWTDAHLGIDIRRAFCYFPMPITSTEEAPRPRWRKTILYTFIVLAFGMSTLNAVFMLTWTGND